MRFNTEAHGEALHARPAQIMQVVRVVEDEVQRLRELAACDESTRSRAGGGALGGLAGGVTGWTTFRESQKSKALIDFARVATRVREHRHLVVLACHVPLREALVVVVDVLRLRPGAHDGGVVDGRDDDFVDVFLRERLCGRPVSIEQSRRWRECTAVASMA